MLNGGHMNQQATKSESSADTREFHCATHGRLIAGAILTTGQWHDCAECDTHLFVPRSAHICQDETATHVNGRWLCNCPKESANA
jgi:hypothetical protein